MAVGAASQAGSAGPITPSVSSLPCLDYLAAVPLGVWGMTKTRTLRRKGGNCVSRGSVDILVRLLAHRARLPVAICLSWFLNKIAKSASIAARASHCIKTVVTLVSLGGHKHGVTMRSSHSSFPALSYSARLGVRRSPSTVLIRCMSVGAGSPRCTSSIACNLSCQCGSLSFACAGCEHSGEKCTRLQTRGLTRAKPRPLRRCSRSSEKDSMHRGNRGRRQQ